MPKSQPTLRDEELAPLLGQVIGVAFSSERRGGENELELIDLLQFPLQRLEGVDREGGRRDPQLRASDQLTLEIISQPLIDVVDRPHPISRSHSGLPGDLKGPETIWPSKSREEVRNHRYVLDHSFLDFDSDLVVSQKVAESFTVDQVDWWRSIPSCLLLCR